MRRSREAGNSKQPCTFEGVSNAVHAMPDPMEDAFVVRVVTWAKTDRRAAHSTVLLRSACAGQAMLAIVGVRRCNSMLPVGWFRDYGVYYSTTTTLIYR